MRRGTLLGVLILALLATVGTASAPALSALDSYPLRNWAGYYLTGASINSVSATWVVPTVSNTDSGYSSVWIGIGGLTKANLIQAGTEQDCLPGGMGTGDGLAKVCEPTYYAWWETHPTNVEQRINMTVHPGDVIHAYIEELSPGIWTIHIEDQTTGRAFTTSVSFLPDKSTAEAIIERPALCDGVGCRLTNLANFGAVYFNNTFAQDEAAGDYFNLLSYGTIPMIDSEGEIMAMPGPISYPGAFSVAWLGSR